MTSEILNKTIHQHIYDDKGDAFQCICGKRKLKLTKTDKEGLRVGTRSDGKSYSVRDHRARYFFPNEWTNFYNVIKKDKQAMFDFLIQTGARIDEARHVRPVDFDFDRNTVRLWKTKTKAKKHERSGKPRTIILSPLFMKRVRRYIRARKVKEDSKEFLFVGNKNIPVTKQAVWQMMKRKLKAAEIKDDFNFSLHNIRKTHGNWIKALGVPAEEICLRLGHNFETYLKHYGSSSIFNNKDIMEINKILEGLYQQRRSF
jgi:integrase